MEDGGQAIHDASVFQLKAREEQHLLICPKHEKSKFLTRGDNFRLEPPESACHARDRVARADNRSPRILVVGHESSPSVRRV